MSNPLEYANSKMAYIIDEYVHKEHYRNILRLRYIAGKTYDGVAEVVGMSPRQIQNIDYWFRSHVLVKHKDELL